MINDEQKQHLLAQFQSYLEQTQLDLAKANEPPDLATLLTEMAGLKAEVKAETRQFKQALDLLNSSLASLEEDNKALRAQLALRDQQGQLQQLAMTKKLLLEVCEFYDRLQTGLSLLENYRPRRSLFKRSLSQDLRLLESFKQGQIMTLRRVEQFLQRYQVSVIECVGKRFDPLTMNARETTYQPKYGPGIVLEELRKGFMIQDQVLRLADVKVSSKSEIKP
jgi:molecular chaperone GrpE